MAIKTICSIPLDWTLSEYERHTCDDGSHQHLSFSQAREHETKGLLVWLVQGKTKRERSVAFILPDREAPVTKTPRCPPMNTGLSYRVGEILALAIYAKESWALAMHSQIRMRRPEPDPILLTEFQSFINS